MAAWRALAAAALLGIAGCGGLGGSLGPQAEGCSGGPEACDDLGPTPAQVSRDADAILAGMRAAQARFLALQGRAR